MRASGSAPRASTAAATRRTTSSGLPARARSTSHAPARDSPSSARATSSASRLFPTPGGPVSVTSRCSRSSSTHLGELLLATDERRRRGGQVAAAPRRDRGGGDRGVVREDRLLQPAQLGARLERHLLGEHAPGLAVSLERVGLAAAAIEREHQLPPQPLPERVLLERRSKRGDDLAMVSERERRLELLFERVDSKRLEPPRLGAEPGGVREPVQRRAAPELQREGNGLGRGSGIARPQCTTRLCEQLLESQRVDGRVGQRVSIGRRDDRVRPSAARRRATWCWTALRGAAGRSSSHNASISESTPTTRPQRSASSASRPWRLLPLTFAGRPPARTSNGPSSRISSEWIMRAGISLHAPVSHAPARRGGARRELYVATGASLGGRGLVLGRPIVCRRAGGLEDPADHRRRKRRHRQREARQASPVGSENGPNSAPLRRGGCVGQPVTEAGPTGTRPGDGRRSSRGARRGGSRSRAGY